LCHTIFIHNGGSSEPFRFKVAARQDAERDGAEMLPFQAHNPVLARGCAVRSGMGRFGNRRFMTPRSDANQEKVLMLLT